MMKRTCRERERKNTLDVINVSIVCLVGRLVGWRLCGVLVNKSISFGLVRVENLFYRQSNGNNSQRRCVVFSFKGQKNGTCFFQLKEMRNAFIYMCVCVYNSTQHRMVERKRNTKSFSLNFCRFPLSWTEAFVF